LWTVGAIIAAAGTLSWLSLRDAKEARDHHPTNATTT
jgi:hypothetical protein